MFFIWRGGLFTSRRRRQGSRYRTWVEPTSTAFFFRDASLGDGDMEWNGMQMTCIAMAFKFCVLVANEQL